MLNFPVLTFSSFPIFPIIARRMILYILPVLCKRNNRQNKKISNVDSNFHDKLVLREEILYFGGFRLPDGSWIRSGTDFRRSMLASLSPWGVSLTGTFRRSARKRGIVNGLLSAQNFQLFWTMWLCERDNLSPKSFKKGCVSDDETPASAKWKAVRYFLLHPWTKNGQINCHLGSREKSGPVLRPDRRESSTDKDIGLDSWWFESWILNSAGR